jgi:hypothetical protein
MMQLAMGGIVSYIQNGEQIWNMTQAKTTENYGVKPDDKARFNKSRIESVGVP